MAEETIFSKIIRHEIKSDIVYQDDSVTAFRDIAPKAKTHILIIPNKIIPSVNEIEVDDEKLIGHLFTVAKLVAEKEGIAADGFRLIFNCGKNGGQEVPHLHMHLLGGEPLKGFGF